MNQTFAISIRQPWAYLIVQGFKDIENRDWPTKFRGRVLVHASKGMTRGDYEACALFCSGLPEGALPPDFSFPAFDELPRGGIVGEVKIVDCVSASDSPWFMGQYGFVLKDARPSLLTPCKGALGFFSPDIAVKH